MKNIINKNTIHISFVLILNWVPLRQKKYVMSTTFFIFIIFFFFYRINNFIIIVLWKAVLGFFFHFLLIRWKLFDMISFLFLFVIRILFSILFWSLHDFLIRSGNGRENGFRFYNSYYDLLDYYFFLISSFFWYNMMTIQIFFLSACFWILWQR